MEFAAGALLGYNSRLETLLGFWRDYV
jgi:hypothetical protein